MLANDCPNQWDVLGLFGDGYNGKAKPGQFKGHSDFPGHEIFDYTREDHGWSSPFNPFSTGRHFQDISISVPEVTAAIDACDKEGFERSMHRMQDFESHYNKGYRYNGWMVALGLIENGTSPGSGVSDIVANSGHAFAGTLPDEDPVAWEHAAASTTHFLGGWNHNCCKCGDKWKLRRKGSCAN
jgi:hypothetical protein